MALVNLHDGETFVRIRICKWAGEFEVFEYLNCYAFYVGDRLFVRSYDDSPDMLPRASFRNQDVLMVEHYGEHKPTKKAARQPAEAPAAPSAALPSDEESEAAMKRFLAAAPKAESHLPERKFLESPESDADPKDGSSIAGESSSDQKMKAISFGNLVKLPLETQSEEVEHRKNTLQATHLLAEIPSTAGPEMSFSGSAANRAMRRAQSKGSHKRPKPSSGQALSALVVPLLTFFLAGFRHRMG